jgi:hypothetical protein
VRNVLLFQIAKKSIRKEICLVPIALQSANMTLYTSILEVEIAKKWMQCIMHDAPFTLLLGDLPLCNM